MPFFSNVMKYTMAMGGLALAMTPMVAKAGFDWTPPPAQPRAAAPEAVQNAVPMVDGPLTPELDSVGTSPLPVPVGNVDSTSLAPAAPQPIVQQDFSQGDLSADLPVPGMKSLPMKAAAPAPVMRHVSSVPASAPTSVRAVADSGPVVEGFGKDIPLALALRDIVPSSYAYAFGSGDLAGLKVSWRGGKPWMQVLSDALAPLDLEAAMQGNVVMIYARQYSAPAPVAAIPSYAPPVAPVIEPTPVPQVVSKRGMPVVDLTVKRKWEARPGSTLREVLDQWSREANVDLNWSTAYDYPVSSAFYFEGTYGEAVDSLLSSYGGESPAPKGRLYPNQPDGPSVLMIN